MASSNRSDWREGLHWEKGQPIVWVSNSFRGSLLSTFTGRRQRIEIWEPSSAQHLNILNLKSHGIGWKRSSVSIVLSFLFFLFQKTLSAFVDFKKQSVATTFWKNRGISNWRENPLKTANYSDDIKIRLTRQITYKWGFYLAKLAKGSRCFPNTSLMYFKIHVIIANVFFSFG